ncbi:MAG: 5-(carboxyamino)imidazole ribonucleotide synthase [Verrucomicrobiota bacterium]
MQTIYQPGATIGMLGGGQLGRMSILAGRALGYRFHVFEPKAGCCATSVADGQTVADYSNAEALREFASHCDVVTLEFENVAREAVDVVTEAGVPVHPGGNVLHICQNRRREKEFLRDNGFPCVDFRVVANAEEFAQAVAELGTPCVLKTADFGYDGKGQVKVEDASADLAQIWKDHDCPMGVVEAWAPFAAECSIVVARGYRGECSAFPMAENVHRNHILHQSIVPARMPEEIEMQAVDLAVRIAHALEVVGLIAVEFFVMPDGTLLVNECAPRPHNSGHYTMDACRTSQFEQHVRAVTGMPLGNTSQFRPAVMVNLLGDVWRDGQTPDWSRLLADPDVKLHLYDKGEPKQGRKMGHFTVVKDSIEEAMLTADHVFAALDQ